MWLVLAADPGDHLSAECWTLTSKIPTESLDSDLGVDFLLSRNGVSIWNNKTVQTPNIYYSATFPSTIWKCLPDYEDGVREKTLSLSLKQGLCSASPAKDNLSQ